MRALGRGLLMGCSAVLLAATPLTGQEAAAEAGPGRGAPAPVIRDERLLVGSMTLAAVEGGEYAIAGKRQRWVIPVAGAVAGGVLAWLFWKEDCPDCMLTIPTPVRGALMGGALGLAVELTF